MAPLRSLLCALALTAGGASAFVAPTAPFGVSSPSSPARRPVGPIFGESDKDGGAAIAKPQVKTEIKTKTTQKSKQASKRRVRSSDPVHRRDDDFEDAPMYKLMLLGDEEYDQAHVIERLCVILEEMDEDQASSVFDQAQISGKAMCGKYPFEHAEMYKEQLVRSDPMIYSDLEEENKKQ